MENSIMHHDMCDMSNRRKAAPSPEEVCHTTEHRLSVSMEDDDRFSLHATITEGSCQLGEEGLGQRMDYGDPMNIEDLCRLRALIDKAIDIMGKNEMSGQQDPHEPAERDYHEQRQQQQQGEQ
jgi:hypothetical protein